jgi:ATP-dependent Clp protease ATP-binding subunit ClpX
MVAPLRPLDREAMRRILIEPKNAVLKQYTQLLKMDDVALEFTDDAIDAVAELALKTGTGARALRSILEGALMDIMYDAPSQAGQKRCIIDADVILKQTTAVLEVLSGPTADE